LSPGIEPREDQRPSKSTEWAESFEPAFDSIDRDSLGRVRFVQATALDDEFVAVVYDDHFGVLVGRIYSVTTLEQGLQNQTTHVDAASGFVMGDLIEPSPPGKELDHLLLNDLHRQFPAIKWSGEIDLFQGETPF